MVCEIILHFEGILNYAGEVYVLNDGGEVDLDLGNYERYLNVTLSRDNNITTGKIYREVIEKEVRQKQTCSRKYPHILAEEGRIPWQDSPGMFCAVCSLLDA